MEIAAWLRSLGLEQYTSVFRDNAVDADVLPQLTEEHLKELGVPLGHRLKLLKAITALQTGAAQEKASVEPAASIASFEGQRRQVTVLFADLSGYTKLSREVDAEEVHALLEQFFDLVDRLVLEHGGHIDKHIGDCAMAVFGAPISHGNDTERAVCAALAIRQAMPELSRRVGREIAVHIGVACGQVVASGTGSSEHREYTITGDTVNLASRLTDQAKAGEILISEQVHRALSGRLDVAEAGMLSDRSFAVPVRALRLHGLLPIPPERWPLVGRKSELRQFRGALAACRETGHGQVVYVRGEAGIGKTRLVEAFQDAARESGFACHTGLVLDFGTGTGRDAIRTLVRGLLGLDVSSRTQDGGAAAETAVAQGLVDAEDTVFLNDLLDLSQPTELRALYEAMDNAARNEGKRRTVARLVERASRLQPRLLVVEDLHWADSLTLAHLAELAATAAACRVLLVMTSRIEGDPLDHVWRARSSNAPLTTIDLGPLHVNEARAMAGALLAASAALVERCIERAAGNPLFLEQLLRHAEESTDVGVPGSVQSLVQARLDQLEPQDRVALQAASVLGQRFGRDALSHLLEKPDYALERLVAHFVVRPQGDDFLFAHALIRDAVYDGLLKSRRRALHRRAADWFAARDPVLRAEHLDRAEDAEAPSAYLEAAKAQADLLRYERALEMTERGLALAAVSEQKWRLGLLRGDLLRELGRVTEAIRAFREVLDLATDDLVRCQALIGIASGVRLLGGYQEGIDALDRAESLARRHDAPRELARIFYYRGCLLFTTGNVDGCLAQHEQARDAAVRAGNPEWEAQALSGLGDAYYGRGQMRLALEQFRRCRALCRRWGFGRIEVGSTHMIGVTRRYLLECREAIDDLRTAVETAAKVGNARTEMVALNLLGELLADAGDFPGAYETLQKSLAIAGRFGNRRFRAYVLYELGRAYWHDLSRQDEAEPILAEALALSRETDIRFIGPRVLAASALAAGQSRSQALDEGEALVRGGCLAHNGLWFYRDAIEASLGGREWDRTERYAAALEGYTQQERLPWADFFIMRGRTLAAHGRGQRDVALERKLRRLCDEAKRVSLEAALPAIETALAGGT